MQYNKFYCLFYYYFYYYFYNRIGYGLADLFV